MDGLSKCILICLDRIGMDRTISATYYILKGKKSSQTMQDIHLFKLTRYFYLFPDLHRSDYDRCLIELIKNGFIQNYEENYIVLTQSGKQIIDKINVPDINGMKYGKIAHLFWKRILLLVQSISNLNINNNTFKPIVIEEDIQLFIKKFLLSSPISKETINQKIFEECFLFLQSRQKIECEIFVLKLTGAERIGLTNRQIAIQLNMNEWDVYVSLQSMLHDLIKRIEEFPVLSIVCPKKEIMKFGESTNKTYHLLQKNKTIEEISNIRNLKKSTIEDHVIEIIMNTPTISIDNYVSLYIQNKIKEIYKKVNSKKLSDLKKHLDDEISYFEIRIVIARMEHND